MQEGFQVVPSPALADQRAVRGPRPPAVCPQNSALPSPDGRAHGSPGAGKGSTGEEDGAAQGELTSALPAAAVADPGRVRARPVHPPATGLSWAPGSPALRPRVPKLLNLRAAHALRGRRPTRRIGPLGWLGPALALPSAPLGGPLPLSAQCSCSLSVAPPLRLVAPSRERGQFSARTREGIPPFAVPPLSRPPFPGSAGKNGLERQAPESVAPSRTPVPAAGALLWERRAGSTRALVPGAEPLPSLVPPCTPGIPHSRPGTAVPGILGAEQGRGASRSLSFPIRVLEK